MRFWPLLTAFLVTQPSFADLPENRVQIRHEWTDDAGKVRRLISHYLDKKADTLHLQICESATSSACTERVIEGETKNSVDKYSTPYFYWWIDLKDGLRYKKNITNSITWPNDEPAVLDPEQVRDDRQVLALETESGVPYLDFFYLPTHLTGSVPKIVVMFKGGESGWTGSWAYEGDLSRGDPAIIRYFRDKGFIVLLANWRGKGQQAIRFRTEGIGRVWDLGVGDVLRALDALEAIHPFDRSQVHLWGFSMGGWMSALTAARFPHVTQRYQVTRTISESGPLDLVNGYYGYFQGPPDFVFDDWMQGALCYRPAGRFSDSEWQSFQAVETTHFTEFFSRWIENPGPLCKTESYFLNSPFHQVDASFPGKILLIAGAQETGVNQTVGAELFRDRVGADKATLYVHPGGHGMNDYSQYWPLFERFLGL